MQRRAALVSACLGAVAGVCAAAQATPKPWPNKPVRIIVVYLAGGVSDHVCRVIARKLGPLLGVPILVENRAGSGGSVGMELLAKATPDGNTIAFSAISPLTLLPYFVHTSYDPVRDFAPVIGVMHTPTLLVGTPSFAGETVPDITRLAGMTPTGLRWATSGIGTTGHVLLEQLRAATGANIVHIPYKGGGQQLNDALSGHFELLSTNVGPTQLMHIRGQKLKPLAVGAPSRLQSLPSVHTFAELGYPGANLASLFGIFAPSRTPTAILQRLNVALNNVLTSPDVRAQLLGFDNLPAGGTPEQFATWIARDRLRSAEAVSQPVRQ